jgi:hypothetical protein
MNLLFTLFRIKIIRPSQVDFFEDVQQSHSDIIKAAINEKPFKEIRKGHVWHIGNIEEVGEEGLFFALGRVKKLITDKYDENSGDFVDVEDEQAPYTHVFIDLEYQICAIAHKAKVSQQVTGSAKNLAKLLAVTNVASQNYFMFDVPELISNAFVVKEFNISFSPPNPWDVEKDFHKPMENLLQQTGGAGGQQKLMVIH